MTEWKLIREYVDNGSQRAFADLTDRHMNLVYWTCYRDLGSHAQAEDASQVVLILLAQRARSFNRSVSLSSWLFNTARLVAQNFRKMEARQRQLEEKAVREMEVRQADAWTQVEPLLNDGISSLGNDDREAIILRFFEGLSLGEVAFEIGTTEDTARKRVARAVERLRIYFLKKEVAVSSVVIAAMLAEHPARAVPERAHLALHTSHSPSSSLAASHHAALIKKGMAIAMQTTQKKLIAGAVAVVFATLATTGAIAVYRSHAAAHGPVVTDLSGAQPGPADPQSEAFRQAVLAILKNSRSKRTANGFMIKYGSSSRASSLNDSFDGHVRFTLLHCQCVGVQGTAEVRLQVEMPVNGTGKLHIKWLNASLPFPVNSWSSLDSTLNLRVAKRNGQWDVTGEHLSNSAYLNGRKS